MRVFFSIDNFRLFIFYLSAAVSSEPFVYFIVKSQRCNRSKNLSILGGAFNIDNNDR